MQKKLTALLAAVALVGASGVASAQTVVNADVTTDTTWSGEVILENPIFVRSNATLTILAGTIVRGQPRSGPVVPGSTAGSPGALIVTREGKIIAEGSNTPSGVIIMTTAAVDNVDNTTLLPPGDGIADDVDGNGFEDVWTAGDTFLDDDPSGAPLAPLDAAGEANVALWGGLVVLGNAPVNVSGATTTTGIPGTGVVEGLTVPGFPEAQATYGGELVHDSSGILRYVSVRHAGDEIGNGNELNGVTLAGVGDGTVLSHIEVYCNFDDGIEWFGGTVGGDHLHVAYAGDDSFDTDQGHTGIIQYAFAVMPFFDENDGGSFGSASGDKAGEWDGDDSPGDVFLHDLGTRFSLITGDEQPDPLQSTIMYNLTVLGSTAPGVNPAVDPASDNEGVEMRNGFAGELRNSYVVNTGTRQGYDVADGGGAPGFTPGDNIDADVDGDGAGDYIRVVASTFDDGAALPALELDALANGDALTGAGPLVGNIVNFAPVAGLVNEDGTFDPQGNASGKLDASLKASATNPRPLPGLGGGGPARATHIGTEDTSFRGAFGTTEPVLWTTGWTALNLGGILAD